MLIGLILLSVRWPPGAQLTLKHGMNQVTDSTGALKLTPQSLKDVLTTPAVLGRPVPVRALGGRVARRPVPGVAVVRVSVRLAHVRADPAGRPVRAARERCPPLRWAGVFFIIAGIVLVAQTPHR